MRAVNHIVVNSLKDCKSSENEERLRTVALQGAFYCCQSTAQQQTNISFFQLSIRECNKIGVKVSKDCVTTSIKQVMDFFFTGKSFKGKLFTKKSTSKVVHVNRQSRESEMLDQVSDFSDQRGEESPMIVSCDDHAKKELCHAMAEPYLIISSTDLNTCNFSKCLGNIMLETRPNLFLETSNLSTVGRGRVEKVITDIRQLFDNRLRVFMFGSSTLEHLSERRFAAHDETELFD